LPGFFAVVLKMRLKGQKKVVLGAFFKRKSVVNFANSKQQTANKKQQTTNIYRIKARIFLSRTFLDGLTTIKE